MRAPFGPQQKQQNMQKEEITVSLPEVSSYNYKDNVKEIEELVRGLNGFTLNLEGKVNTMLKGQETEFVKSYKQHMMKIEEALAEYQRRIEGYQKKIQHYENEGVLAILLKKIQFLQENEKKLLNSLEKKDKVISFLKGEVGTQKRQILSLHNKIKELLLLSPNQQSGDRRDQQKREEPTFATQIHTAGKQTLKTSNNYSVQYMRSASPTYRTIPDPQMGLNPQSKERREQIELRRVNQQLGVLKRKHRELSSFNSKIIEKASSIEQFFVRVVNDLKRKISGRKKFTECTLQDFKQEDKLQLLVKVLSNEEVLQHLYGKIFAKAPRIDLEQAKWENRDAIKGKGAMSGRGELVSGRHSKLGRSQRVVERLPDIATRR